MGDGVGIRSARDWRQRRLAMRTMVTLMSGDVVLLFGDGVAYDNGNDDIDIVVFVR